MFGVAAALTRARLGRIAGAALAVAVFTALNVRRGVGARRAGRVPRAAPRLRASGRRGVAVGSASLDPLEDKATGLRRWTPFISIAFVAAFIAGIVLWPKDPREAQRSGRHRAALDSILARAAKERPTVGEPTATTKRAVDALVHARSTEITSARGFSIASGDSATCFELVAIGDTRTDVVVKVFEEEGKPPVLAAVALEPPCRCDRKGYLVCD